jgi:Transmembrane domain of unknown function (DUF3566)
MLSGRPVAERKKETEWRAEAEEDPAPTSATSTSTESDADGERAGRSSRRPASGASQQSRQAQDERTDVIPRGLRTTDPERSQTPAAGTAGAARRGRPGIRRVRRVLRHGDPFSVLKLSLFYYACFVVLWLVFVAVLYTALSSTGLLDRVETLGRLFVLWESIDISLWFVERWALVIGLAGAVIASLVNVLLAVLYNLAADVVGGAELTFVDREP